MHAVCQWEYIYVRSNFQKILILMNHVNALKFVKPCTDVASNLLVTGRSKCLRLLATEVSTC